MSAHCAGDQVGFWEFQDILFSIESCDPDNLRRQAETSGLDGERFSRCLSRGDHRKKVQAAVEKGKNAGVSATPTFLVNGKVVTGPLSFEAFKEEIEQALRENRVA